MEDGELEKFRLAERIVALVNGISKEYILHKGSYKEVKQQLKKMLDQLQRQYNYSKTDFTAKQKLRKPRGYSV